VTSYLEALKMLGCFLNFYYPHFQNLNSLDLKNLLCSIYFYHFADFAEESQDEGVQIQQVEHHDPAHNQRIKL